MRAHLRSLVIVMIAACDDSSAAHEAGEEHTREISSSPSTAADENGPTTGVDAMPDRPMAGHDSALPADLDDICQIYALQVTLSCSFELHAPVGLASSVHVELNETPLAADEADGWTLGDDHETLKFHGETCETLRAGFGQIAVEVRCEGGPLI